MYLVLSDPHDVPALWAYEHLRRTLGEQVQIVTTGMLAAAFSWEHAISRDGDATFRIELADRRVIDSAELHGVLNRLLEAPIPHWAQSSDADRVYVQQEMSAFYLSWLNSIRCPIFNPATPQGLSGQWRHESEWLMLAAEAGLPTPAYALSSRDPAANPAMPTSKLRPTGASVYTAIVADQAVTGVQLPPQIEEACRTLAKLSATPLLGIDFIATSSRTPLFAGATPFPNLQLGGPALIHGLAAAFTAHEALVS